MRTFAEAYCAEYACDPNAFRRRLFWACLPLHARLVALLTGGYDGKFFAAEYELIAGVSRATTMQQIRDEITDYFMDPVNLNWTRKTLKVRISTRRLKSIARRFVSDDSHVQSAI